MPNLAVNLCKKLTTLVHRRVSVLESVDLVTVIYAVLSGCLTSRYLVAEHQFSPHDATW